MALHQMATRYNEETERHPLKVLAGALLFSFSLFLLLCLVTYNQSDPSLNQATANTANNIGGYAGALVADLMLQFLGLASIFAAIVPLAWSAKLLKGENITFLQVRLSLLIITLVLAASLLTEIDPPIWWSIKGGLGGSIGMTLHNSMHVMFKSTLFTVMVFSITIITASLAFGMKLDEWKELAQISKKAFFVAAGVILSLIQRKERDDSYEYEEAEEKLSLRERFTGWISNLRSNEYEEEEEDEEPVRRAPRVNKKSQAKDTEKAARAKPKVQTTLALPQGDYELPDINLLSPPPKGKKTTLSENALTQNAKLLESVLQDFGVNGNIVEIRPGPVVTLYELEPAAGTKSSRVIGLADDIARSMSAISTRIAVIPGRNAIGIEMPNAYRETVYFREMLETNDFSSADAKLPLALGKNIGGEPIIVDLARMPHLLVAGTTGSGKSVAINTMIMSLLYRLTPEECKFIMIDPKMLELSVYDGIPHLLSPVVTEPGKAVVALKWTVKEMENRYRLMNNHAVRNIEGYNKKIREAKAKGNQLSRKVQTGFNPDTGEPIIEEMPLDMNELPFIVVVVDEMADLMIVAGKEIEGSIQRLAQMARAAGIHIIMATQRPSVDVITGVIKANFPTRISFQVTSRIDSRTILGEQGAEQLLGQGDMLYMAGGGRITRVHGPFVSDKEVEQVVGHLKLQGEPSYIEDVTRDEEEEGAFGEEGEKDEMYDQAVAIIARDRKASTSYIQRCLKIGYNRAASIIEQMEREGIVGPANHVGKREVLVREDG
ncbi:MAG: DNA translocase FtsK 4TM domain-containing protein [Pseudomonadota bacterium]